MYSELFPIGSVVLLKGGSKRLMIVGRVVSHDGGEEINDYIGCFYPQGVVDVDNLFFFNQDSIEAVFFIGFQDSEEIEFKKEVLSKLDEGKVVVENGQITVINE